MREERGQAPIAAYRYMGSVLGLLGWRNWVAVLVSLACYPSSAWAHGFGQRYDLPIPLEYFLSGSVAAVLLSFVVIAFFARSVAAHEHYSRFNLLGIRWVRWCAAPVCLALLRTCVVVIFLLSLVTGLAGPHDPSTNLLPVMVWVIWWVGMAYASALLGDIWALINPWSTIFSWFESVYSIFRPGKPFTLGIRYPAKLGVWPALILFFAFTWCELVWTNNAVPLNLATSIVIYSCITWLGMFLVGRHAWLEGGEAFSVVFGLLARFAPTEYRVATGSACLESQAGKTECVNHLKCFAAADRADRELNLRVPGMGLLIDQPVSLSMMLFVVLMLATVTFDGLTATPFWQQVLDTVPTWRWSMRTYFELEMAGIYRNQTTLTAGLMLFPLLFFGFYWTFSAVIKWVAGASESARQIAALFVLSLVPIAIAYHLAHYLSYLLIVGQVVIPLVSDPMGYGWDLFGSADYRADIGIIGARTVWYTAVISIVLGHIIAVYVAHVIALRTFKKGRAVLLSQVPMLVLMLFYTFMSLWILAQPIVE